MAANAPTVFSAGNRQGWYTLISAGASPGGAPLPLVVVPGGDDWPEQLPDILQHFFSLCGKTVPSFVLAGFASTNWNRDYSPWPAPALFQKDGDFSGGAPQTLTWLADTFLPALEEALPAALQKENLSILGYSLAGLFSLWAFFQHPLFTRAGSCSGSLWFNGWPNYLASATAKPHSRVYLSLGLQEEKARNPRMAAVGDATRSTAAWLSQNPSVAASTLEWMPGGHFSNAPRRLATALAWLVQP